MNNEDILAALDRLENDALSSSDGYGDDRKDAAIIRAALTAKQPTEKDGGALDALQTKIINHLSAEGHAEAAELIRKSSYAIRFTAKPQPCTLDKPQCFEGDCGCKAPAPKAGDDESFLDVSAFRLCNGYPHDNETDRAIEYLRGEKNGTHSISNGERNIAVNILLEFAEYIRKGEKDGKIIEIKPTPPNATIKSDNTETLYNALERIEQLEAVNKQLVRALKYAHSHTQPLWDATIIKQALAAAEKEGV